MPLILKETGTEDYKGIRIQDKNEITRYTLIFTSGHLNFAAYDANSSVINSKQLA